MDNSKNFSYNSNFFKYVLIWTASRPLYCFKKFSDYYLKIENFTFIFCDRIHSQAAEENPASLGLFIMITVKDILLLTNAGKSRNLTLLTGINNNKSTYPSYFVVTCTCQILSRDLRLYKCEIPNFHPYVVEPFVLLGCYEV